MTLKCPSCGAELAAEPWRGAHLLLAACCGSLVQVIPGHGFLCQQGAEAESINEALIEQRAAYERPMSLE